MRHRIKVQVKPSQSCPEGKELIAEYPDRDTAEAQLRSMERFHRARWGFPQIHVETIEGESWCLSYNQIIWPVTLEAVEGPVAAG